MIYRRTNLLPVCIAFILLAFTSKAIAICNLENTPLTYERMCSEFMESDKALNTIYKKLISGLNKDSKSTLRAAQREWIKWRDEKCDQVQEESGCNQNGSCNDVAHDMCIIDLTDQRTRELKKFSVNVKDAEGKKFTYSQNYK